MGLGYQAVDVSMLAVPGELSARRTKRDKQTFFEVGCICKRIPLVQAAPVRSWNHKYYWTIITVHQTVVTGHLLGSPLKIKISYKVGIKMQFCINTVIHLQLATQINYHYGSSQLQLRTTKYLIQSTTRLWSDHKHCSTKMGRQDTLYGYAKHNQ